jgi:diguanylate cyclase (GGDEF)-like protein
VISDRLHRQAYQALNLAHSDPLTGLPNRRILELFLEKNFQAAKRGRQLSIALFDVDDFKHHNDTGGHSAGDEVLRLIARILNLNTRGADLSGRMGGDEFLAVLGDEDSSGALAFADRILRQLSSMGEDQKVGLSVGIATCDESMASWDDLLKAADVALYAAKESGGGRAVIHAPAEPRPAPDICPELRGAGRTPAARAALSHRSP